MINKAEIERIKQSVDIRELASSYVKLQGSHEMSGPCPKCGGEDRFHCKAGWFFCRKCHENWGDAIDFVMWLEECTFEKACQSLGTGVYDILLEQRKASSTRKPRIDDWATEKWQASARKIVYGGISRLKASDTNKGRRYLESRGIRADTWKAWGIGYEPNVKKWFRKNGDWRSEDLGPAIILPWVEHEAIKAVQYRFIEVGRLRYWQKSGGDRSLFGLPLLTGRSTLIVCEGELNAVSIWQAASDLVDVVSFGSEGNLGHSEYALKTRAGYYDNVVVWADKADRAAACRDIVGARAKALKSPRGLDANDLLQKGQLREFLEAALKKFGFWQKVEQHSAWLQTVDGVDTHAGGEVPEHIARLIGKPLLSETDIADLQFEADRNGRQLVWQRYDLNDPFAGWQNVN